MTPARLAKTSLLGLALALAWLPGAARGDVEVESESVYRSFDSPSLSEEDLVLQPFSQAFRLTAARRREDSRVSFETYFRGIGSQTERGPGFREQARVYYAYVDIARGKRHPWDLRLGRQMAAAGGELMAFDGARVRYRSPSYFGVEVFGGTTVSGYGAVVPLGLEQGGAQVAGGIAGGLAVFLSGVPHTTARVGFRRIDREGGVDREDVAIDASRRFGRTRVYGNGQVSTALGMVEEGLLGATLYTGRATYVDFEAFHYTPSFGAQSIFNVFRIESYNEGRFRVRTTVLRGRAGLWARLGTSLYGGGQTSHSVNAGGTLRLGPYVTASARGIFSSGYLGSRAGGGADFRWRVLDDRLTLLGGVTAAQAENELLITSNGTYLSAVGGASYTIPDRAELSVLVEQLSDDFSSGEPRVSASLRFKFGAGSARRSALAERRRVVRP